MRSLWRFLSVWASTHLTVQVVGVSLAAPCIALYRYHGNTIDYAPRVVPGLMVTGAVLTFVPCLLYAALLAVVVGHGLRRNWPTWTPYAASLALTSILFFGLISLTSRPIPDIAMYFTPEAPDVARPAIALSEVPLLVASIVAGLLGAWVCVRVRRLGCGERDAQPGNAGDCVQPAASRPSVRNA